MTQKFQILKSCIVSPKRINIENITKACCILHNFVRKMEGRVYVTGEVYRDEADETRPAYMEPTNFHLIIRDMPGGISRLSCALFPQRGRRDSFAMEVLRQGERWTVKFEGAVLSV